jgi:hypothetical protein
VPSGGVSPAGARIAGRSNHQRAWLNADFHLILEASLLQDGLGKADAAGITDSDEAGLHKE